MDRYEQVIELAKRRGFLWNSFELYGGAAGFYDYGPLGCTLKRRIEQIWRELYVIHEGFMEIETPTVGIEDVFVASGHVGGFSDPLCECQECEEAFRADHLVDKIVEVADALSNEELDRLIKENDIGCPECGGKLGKAYEFNLMFKTNIGPGTGRQGYMRPETAQGMFINFQRLSRYYRDKLPFGATQIGKSYRNEISPRQGVIRLREFTQAEAEIFTHPKEKGHPNFERFAEVTLNLYSDEAQEKGAIEQMTVREAVENDIIAHEFLAYHIALTNHFLQRVGIAADKLRFRQHQKDEMAHYAIDCWDAEILTDRFGWIEVVGIADRTDFDLKAHAKTSGTKLEIHIEYDEPKMVEQFVVKPDMGKLGPLFKGKAKAVADALRELSEDELSKDEIKVIVNGEKFTVPSEIISYAQETVKVSGEKIVPHVIEPSYGIDRILYCTMEHAFDEEKVEVEGDEEEEERMVLRFRNEVAPVQVAILPLLTRDELIEPAKAIAQKLRERGLLVAYDDSRAIGRRYRRNDEIGTPYSITIDYDTLEDNSVTIRDRDTMKQVRASVEGIENSIYDLVYGKLDLENTGVSI
ncbi:glycine--tRNA ligase [Methanococcoides burtonii]|uniref:glycine--tRNA ligase n=1 Tax=Methanococcoides burtonii (strain DSM 6242 / NBRC 107633 / OCM 468 / ACE-M) TaxID=259564 RepID=Q12XG4_METBU|nr:glycine--tRNA ligase [Methanococcoides burtonii]ABE51862.1 Glycyl-tRNA synthetase [Methanococcoides burtonii DSM 6242]